MCFLQMKEFKLDEVIEKKQRISLIVKYSLSSHLIFFKDKTFQHIDQHTKQIYHNGKLQFVPNKYLQSTKQERVIVMGLSDTDTLCCAVIDTQSHYNIETRQLQNTKPDVSTLYHLHEPFKSQESNIYIIRVLFNIENGIALAVYDFWENTWCQQMISLPSKFINFHIVNTSINNHLYQQTHELSCQSFALVALGQKFDSINYSKIKFVYEASQGHKMLKIKFVITRELKLKKQFIVIGGCQYNEEELLLVGNSRKDLDPQQVSHSSAYLLINTAVVQNNGPQQIKIINQQFTKENKQVAITRRFIGLVNSNVVVLLCLPFKQIGVAKFNLNSQQLLVQSRDMKQINFSLSVKKDCLYDYKLECQYFFEKIKKSPSKITYNVIKIYDKHTHYQHLIKNACASLNPFFVSEVLGLLQ